MTRLLPLLIALAIPACGPAPEPANPDMLPIPSGPPVAQQPTPEPLQPAPAEVPQWESVVSGPATSLRLVEAGTPRLALTCLGRPARLVANAPGFKPIGSEDRFSLGLGAEPVTLVADLRAKGGGVTAEAPIPASLPQLLRRARQVSARYGTQQVGPVAPPPPQLLQAFSRSCQQLR
jgi:hypothetical protein